LQRTDCATCHAVYDATGALDDGHRDGGLDLVHAKACSACHDFPPALPHPARPDCATCHPGFDDQGTPTGDTHVDGAVDVGASCLLCHGNPPGAPHLQRADCATCHAVYDAAGALDDGHRDGQLELINAKACVACHAYPPTTGTHPADATCTTCHDATVGADGQLLPGGAHLNGVVDN
jgi:hypothetical protein